MVKKIYEYIEPTIEDFTAEVIQHLAYLERRARLSENFVEVQELQMKQHCVRENLPVRLTSYELPWILRLDFQKAWLLESGHLTEIN